MSLGTGLSHASPEKNSKALSAFLALLTGTDQGDVGDDVGHRAWSRIAWKSPKALSTFWPFGAGTDQGAAGEDVGSQA